MKVYVVTEGEYSYYHICCVCSTKEKAEEARNLYRYHGYDYTNTIEEYELDDYPLKPQGMNAYKVIMDRNGEVWRVGKCKGADISEYGVCIANRCLVIPKWQLMLHAHVWARDEGHAIKIANEKRVQAIANNEWDAVEGRDV